MEFTKYLGVQEKDCAAFVNRVLSDHGKVIELPSAEWRKLSPDQVIEWSKDYAVEVEQPSEMDGVLMRICGSHRVSIGSHIGLYFELLGTPHVLHQWEKYGGMASPLSRLKRLNLEVCGYYAWNR